jgi:hypothetical protein
MKFNTIVSVDPGLAGGLSLFQDNKLVACISMPTVKVETKPARYKLDLLNGKKQFIKSGSNKGKPKMIQVSAAKYDTHLALNEIKDFFSFSEPENVTIILEAPAMSFGNSASSTATTNQNFGKLLAVAELCNLNIFTVPPHKWKKDLNLTKDKELCVKYAEQLSGKSFMTDRGALKDGPAIIYLSREITWFYCL